LGADGLRELLLAHATDSNRVLLLLVAYTTRASRPDSNPAPLAQRRPGSWPSN
jgi:hypothetical protein